MSTRHTTIPEEATVVTHAGNFHADDVFSIVFLENFLYNQDIVIYRSMNGLPDVEKFKPNVIIFDIGHGQFDHHQKGGNGYHLTSDVYNKAIPYASFGLLWKKFGKSFCDRITNNNPINSIKVWQYIEEQLVLGIDAFDNGIYPRCNPDYDYKIITISNIISLLNPTSTEENDYIAALDLALSFARTVFRTKLDTILTQLEQPDFFQNRKKINYFTAEQIFISTLEKRLLKDTNDHSYISKNIEFHSLKSEEQVTSKKLVPISNLGKLWKKHGRKYCDSILKDMQLPDYIWEFINTNFIVGVDADINGIRSISHPGYINYNITTVFDFIESLNPPKYSEEAYKEAKDKAFYFASLIFDRIIQKAIERLNSRQYVQKKIIESKKYVPYYHRKLTTSSKHILVFEKHVHWQDWVANSPLAKDIWFVISPSNQGGYIIRPIPCQYNENGFRKGFPRKWHGLSGKELQKITGVPTATFIHHSRGFIGGAKDLKGAIMLAKKAFDNTECIRIQN